MPAGDISKQLCNRITDDLRDKSYNLIPNKATVYRKLSHYQYEFMTMFHTTSYRFEISLVSGTEEYTLPPRLLLLKNWSTDDSETNIEFYIDDAKGKVVVIDGEIGDATKLYLDAYIKPATHMVDDTEIPDDICGTYDPIIQKQYYEYLIQAVLSDYPTRDRYVRPLGEVYKLVRQISLQTESATNYTP